jgi:hypothetical protein
VGKNSGARKIDQPIKRRTRTAQVPRQLSALRISGPENAATQKL